MTNKSGKNLKYLRKNNMTEILKFLTINDESSRIELSKELGLSKMTITNIVADLLEKDCLVETKTTVQLSSTGPRPMKLCIKEKRFLAIGIYVSREKIQCSLTDITGKDIYIEEKQFDKSQIKYTLIEQICNSVQNALDYDPCLKKNIVGIGVTTVGLIDIDTGVLLKSTGFLGNQKVDIIRALQERFAYPVFVSNDMKAEALAELMYGHGKYYSDFVTIGITYGVGAAVVSDGKVMKGNSGFASEFGHVSINFHGEQCDCGNKGCLELYTSIPILLKKTSSKNLRELVEKIETGDAQTKEVMEKFVETISIALTNLVNVFDPECIIFGHEGVVIVEKFISIVEEYVNEHCIQSKVKHIHLLISSFRDSGGIKGSTALVFSKLFDGQIALLES